MDEWISRIINEFFFYSNLCYILFFKHSAYFSFSFYPSNDTFFQIKTILGMIKTDQSFFNQHYFYFSGLDVAKEDFDVGFDGEYCFYVDISQFGETAQEMISQLC